MLTTLPWALKKSLNVFFSTFITEINGFLTSKLSSSNGSALVVSLLLQEAKANNVNQSNFFIIVWGWYVFLIELQTYTARTPFELKLVLSVKVAFCNEIYQFCKSMNINYENVRKIATLDPRIGEGHTNVPGHDGKCGFGGTCFPKDCHNLLTQMKANNVKSTIIEGAIIRNEKIDRVEKDWNNNKGRAVIFFFF